MDRLSPAPAAVEPAALLAAAHEADQLALATIDELVSADGAALKPGPDPVVLLLPVAAEASIPLPEEHAAPAPKGADPLPQFEGGEHTALGDGITLMFNDAPVRASARPLALPNGLSLTYGQIVALGGDFYGLPGEPIADDPRPPDRFTRAFDSLAKAESARSEALQILKVMQIEIDQVNAALAAGQHPSEVYARLGDTLSGQWNRITGGGSAISDFYPLGRYLKLAADNWDHFGTHAVKAYAAGHQAAVNLALQARLKPAGPARDRQLELAYAMNAFADHFLTDLFAAGHLRTPRKDLYNAITPSVLGSYLSRYMHDEDNYFGLFVRNRLGESWVSFGDKMYFETVNAANLRMARRAVQASADEVYAAFRHGKRPQEAAALNLIPKLDDVANASDWRRTRNFSPLFVPAGSTVLARNSIPDLNDHSWTIAWVGASTAAQLQNAKLSDRKFPAYHLKPPAGSLGYDPQRWTAEAPQGRWVRGAVARYAVSFFNQATRAESWPGPWSAPLTVTDKAFPTLTNIPTDPSGQATGRLIYRQFAGGSIELIGTLSDNTATAFVDRTP
ncbi:MAG TPA: hypothetical protein VGE07_18460 [Herpetosiphonaceae bacterium]